MRGDGATGGDEGRTMRLDPHYPNVLRRMAAGLANGEFEKGSERQVMAAIIDQVRYLAKTDEASLFPIMHELDPSRPATMQEALDDSQARDSSGQ
jgi:hypothetical protein